MMGKHIGIKGHTLRFFVMAWWLEASIDIPLAFLHERAQFTLEIA